MTHQVTLIEGDGVGPEVAAASCAVVAAAGATIDWDRQKAGVGAISPCGSPLPLETIQSIIRNKNALKGPTATPIGTGFRSVNVTLRQDLNLFACIRPVKSFMGLPTRFGNVDLVIVRENTEGLYGGKEIEITRGVIASLKIVSEAASLRIADQAFKYAITHGRKKLTVGHKANILKLGDGLFLRSAQQVALDYPHLPLNDSIIDALCMRLVIDPSNFDVIILENLYGDIVSDLCAGLIGGLGLVPGVNLGAETAIFEAVHGTAPDIAGQNKANPTALILSSALLLTHLGLHEEARRVENAVRKVLAKAAYRPCDLGGQTGTREFAQAVIKFME